VSRNRTGTISDKNDVQKLGYIGSRVRPESCCKAENLNKQKTRQQCAQHNNGLPINFVDNPRQPFVRRTVGVVAVFAFLQQISQRAIICTQTSRLHRVPKKCAPYLVPLLANFAFHKAVWQHYSARTACDFIIL